MLTLANPSRRTTNRPWKGRGFVTWHVLNFGCPIHISGMAEARALNFFLQRRPYQVFPKGWRMTPKRGIVLLTWPIFVCATVDLEIILLVTRRAAINKCAHDGLCLSHVRHLRPPTLRLRPKVHRFVLSPCLLQTCLYNMDNESIKWSLSIIIQICANNRHFLVCLTIWYQPTLVAWYNYQATSVGWWAVQYGRFLPRDAMLSAVHAVVVYLSVRLSVCMCVWHSGIV